MSAAGVKQEMNHTKTKGQANASGDETLIVYVSERQVSCDGGNGGLGHPKTYYEMGDEPFVICKYCDTRFVLDTKSNTALA